MNSEMVLVFTFLAVVAFLFFCIQKKVFAFAKRPVFKIMPVIILASSLLLLFILNEVACDALRNKELFTSQTSSVIEMGYMFVRFYAIFVLTAVIGCVTGIVIEITKNKIKTRKNRADT